MSEIVPVLLNDIKVYPFRTASELLDYVDKHKGVLVAINAEKILHATNQTRNFINDNIGYCDGFGAVWALRRKGVSHAVKIAGCELWMKIVEKYYQSKSFYIIGGKQQVVVDTVAKLRSQFDGISIVGFRNGYFDSSEEVDILNDIKEKSPDVVFVAMGSPKQELLMQRMNSVCPNAIYQGLGGSFDVYTGRVERAPKWMIDHNIEYIYRVIKQPRRLLRLLKMAKYVWLVLIGKI